MIEWGERKKNYDGSVYDFDTHTQLYCVCVRLDMLRLK